MIKPIAIGSIATAIYILQKHYTFLILGRVGIANTTIISLTNISTPAHNLWIEYNAIEHHISN